MRVLATLRSCSRRAVEKSQQCVFGGQAPAAGSVEVLHLVHPTVEQREFPEFTQTLLGVGSRDSTHPPAGQVKLPAKW